MNETVHGNHCSRRDETKSVKKTAQKLSTKELSEWKMGFQLLFLLPLHLFLLSSAAPKKCQPANSNPPHGCRNFGLCKSPTQTMIADKDSTETCQLGCSSIDDCVCVNGVSSKPATCDTVNENCNADSCKNKNGHYRCINGIGTTQCVCEIGYGGDDCNTVTDWCANKNLCGNGATCEAVYNGTDYYCNCTEDWQNRNCYKSNILSWNPIKEGCYEYNENLTSTSYDMLSDPSMTIELCRDAARNAKSDFFAVCGTDCYHGEENPMTEEFHNDGDCDTSCPGNDTEQCGKVENRCWVYDNTDKEYEENRCENDPTLCNADWDQGICVNNLDGYSCRSCSLATRNPCQNNATCLEKPNNNYLCVCPDGFSGKTCEKVEICNSTTCFFGGTCTTLDSGDFQCACLQYYYGNRCEFVNRCNYNNPCVHGKCEAVPGVDPMDFSCTCDNGWTGPTCAEMTNFCEPNPCLYGGVCTPKFLGYDCDCPDGSSGVNCSELVDYCIPYTDKKGRSIKTPCNSKDDGAVCTNVLKGYTCNCTEMWIMANCDLSIIIYDVLTAVYGKIDDTMVALLNELMNNPSMIKDLVPFIVGMLDESNRTSLSWTAEDLFEWIAFEQKRLNYEKDIVKWNDVVLGNCFTFNYRDSNETFERRMLGAPGGLQALMRVRQDEYAPWTDVSAILVFIHDKDDYVFSESVRYNAQPSTGTMLNVYDDRYTRLGGSYGVCVRNISEVAAYYYPGAYTTDGCLRTCYQDMLEQKCECMDPRYPMPNGTTTCQLEQRNCVIDASDNAGDPSTWKSCVCPLPCENIAYSVTWSSNRFVDYPVECREASNVSICMERYTDETLITVNLPKLDYQIYQETKSMDLNKFISYLGGLLGVLMGICIISFIELFFLLVHLFLVLIEKDK
ncbi:unnamed protein product [Caenorhabditis auriculariae]|uniref:Uncharacterized protein n=1 Tax=Caenorhabditis auriculariae TaxID=2777116 RepID=A0A8S1HDJ4_9PELO|nr:unnamed protein product [Caenorhabditis auriculariae]